MYFFHLFFSDDLCIADSLRAPTLIEIGNGRELETSISGANCEEARTCQFGKWPPRSLESKRHPLTHTHTHRERERERERQRDREKERAKLGEQIAKKTFSGQTERSSVLQQVENGAQSASGASVFTTFRTSKNVFLMAPLPLALSRIVETGLSTVKSIGAVYASSTRRGRKCKCDSAQQQRMRGGTSSKTVPFVSHRPWLQSLFSSVIVVFVIVLLFPINKHSNCLFLPLVLFVFVFCWIFYIIVLTVFHCASPPLSAPLCELLLANGTNY